MSELAISEAPSCCGAAGITPMRLVAEVRPNVMRARKPLLLAVCSQITIFNAEFIIWSTKLINLNTEFINCKSKSHCKSKSLPSHPAPRHPEPCRR